MYHHLKASSKSSHHNVTDQVPEILKRGLIFKYTNIVCCTNALADARIKRKRDIRIHQGRICRAVSVNHLLYRLLYDQLGIQPN